MISLLNTVESYIPGWDCHGLPIENKALKAIQVDVCIIFNGGPGLVYNTI